MTAQRSDGARIVAFYREQATDDRGRMLSEILAWSDGELEAVHDYIQWLFPLPERSGANPTAPVLDDEAIAAFRADPELQSRLGAAFTRMLAFYGLQQGSAGVERAPDFARHARRWLQPGNHNHLRITRILRSLRLLGLEAESRRLFACLSAIYHEPPPGMQGSISPHTFAFWTRAANAPLE